MPQYALNTPLLIFTDLDGTLLDHYDYSYSLAKPALQTLQDYAVPLILNTSKTSAEVSGLRDELGLNHPFVVENGSAIFIPENYFVSKPKDTVESTVGNNRYWCKRWGGDRSDYLAVIRKSAVDLNLKSSVDFQTFFDAGPQGIAQMTGLSIGQSELANTRSSSEPVAWHASQEKKNEFIAYLKAQNVGVVEGGRFMHISAPQSSKANALKWLSETYSTVELASSPQIKPASYTTIALGDGANDKDMLETADFAIVVRAAKGEPLALSRAENWIVTDHAGPRGWNESLARLLCEPS